MSADWRFYVIDVRSGQALGELPLIENLSITETLNLPGKFDVAIPLETTAVTPADLEPPTAVFGLGVGSSDLIWAGPIWTQDYDVAGGTVKLSGEGWLSYLRRMTLRQRLTFASVDQATIANTLVATAQAMTGGNILIVTSAIVHGVLRDRTYEAFELNRFGTLIENLANVRQGFDFRFEPRWLPASTVMAVDFVTTYPATGRLTDIVLELGNTADIASVSLDGTTLAYEVDAVGRGDGRDIPIARAANTGLIASKVLLDADVRASDVSDMGTLTGYAQRRLDRGQTPIRIPRVTVDSTMLGEFTVGDVVLVRADLGLLQLNDLYRITSWTLTIGQGAEQLSLALAPLLAFSDS